jgi:hypothetical protein
MRDDRNPERRRWRDLTPSRKAVTVLAVIIQLALAGVAWADLARRPATEVNGPKWRWAVVIAINFIGPITYFRWGRIRSLGR